MAATENISVDDLFASAFEERLLEFERLAPGGSAAGTLDMTASDHGLVVAG